MYVANPEAMLELDADGRLISMPPTGGETSCRNSELLFQLQRFARSAGGWKVFDSSGGFPPLCPDLVVEMASFCDQGPRGVSSLSRKMANYQANGAALGWLLLPEEQAVEIWQG